MTPETLAKLDTIARLLIVFGCLLIIVGESIGVLPIAIGVPWIVAGLMGWGRPRMEPLGRQGPPRPPE